MPKCECGKEMEFVGPEYAFSVFKCPDRCNEEETTKVFEAVEKLKSAANRAMDLLRFAKPTEKRKEVISELEESIRECRDSLF